MRDIIDWLVDFETTAAVFYDKAAVYFSTDPELEKLLTELADDERYHASIINEASDYLLDSRPPESLVTLDLDSKKRLERWIKECDEKIDSKELTKNVLLEYIIKLEFSEWNTIFLYISNTFTYLFPEFASVPEKLQEHKTRIVRYVKSLSDTDPSTSELLKDIKKLPDFWNDRFLLVVDDDDTIVNLLRAILESKGTVESASNGQTALNMVQEKHFDVIIMDVNMPVMDGIDFYKESSKIFPDIKDRILFFTGSRDHERTSFFKEHGLRYILKPSPIEKIIEEVSAILKSASSLRGDKE